MPSIMSYYDKDGDGKVSTEELREICLDASQRLRDAFLRLDPTVSGDDRTRKKKEAQN